MADQSMSNSTIVDRNIQLTGEITRYFLQNPAVLEQLPAQFELILLPEDDPDLVQYSLQLLHDAGGDGDPVVFVRFASSRRPLLEQNKPEFYVPLAA
ncbi:hypothetical protein GC175_01475 [bacterium]|nr:hypothetical protein [bacterium]